MTYQPIIIQDGQEFFSSSGEFWIKYKDKNGRFPRGKKFLYYPCRFCGRLISNSGRANHSHLEMHRRKGDCDDRYRPIQGTIP